MMEDALEPASSLVAGKYRLLGLLGQGRTSLVYEAVHENLGSPLAVKVLRPELRKDASLASRFRLEGRTLAQLQHPNIAQVIDLGELDDGRPFVVLQRLWGQTLADELRCVGSFLPAQATTILRGILSGLVRVHSLGVVHRDLSLQNVFMSESEAQEPQPVLLDFGLAKVLGSARAPNAPTPPPCLTPEGSCMGTPRTTAPENAENASVDPRSDVYSAGILLYWLLTGRDPFHDAQNTEEVLQAQITRIPSPPSVWAPNPISSQLDAAVLKALAKNPADRFQSAAEFAEALQVATSPSKPVPQRSPSKLRYWLGTGIGQVTFVIAVAGCTALLILVLFPGAATFRGR